MHDPEAVEPIESIEPKKADDATIPWADGSDPEVLPQVVRRAFAALAGQIEVRPLSGGLLHQSFHVRAGPVDYVLQRISDVFAPEIQDNIQAVTTHLASRGMPCAAPIHTVDGDLSAALGEVGRWRLMPHLGGTSFPSIISTAQAESAGRLVGRFHSALQDFDAPLAPLGIPYRNTLHYLEALGRALDEHATHRLGAEMRDLGGRVATRFEHCGAPPAVPDRVIHGDLKLSNLLFEGPEPPARDVAFALIDLDTLMRAPLWVELGDAWRSWCNPASEESGESGFDLGLFEASLAGFLEGLGAPLSAEERDSLVMAPERITLELCARFVTDALEESYFGWDPGRFASRGDHNAARAASQWDLAEAMRRTRDDRRAILQRLA